MTARRLAGGWRALPARARRRWLGWVGGALALAWALTVALTFAVRALERGGRLAWEAGVLARVAESPLSFANALIANALGSPVLLVPVVLAVAGASAWRGMPLRALSALGTFFLVYLTVQAGWLAWPRARPDLIAEGVAAPGLNSFPSGHVAQSTATWGFVAWLWLRASPSLVERAVVVAGCALVVATVALARLRLGTHWPTDVAAGLAVGAFWLAVLVAALRRAEAEGAG